MDINALISTLVGALASLIGSFGVLYFTLRTDKKTQSLEKIEEIKLLMTQIKEWMDCEKDQWYKEIELNAGAEIHENLLDCPIYRLQALVEINEPSLIDLVIEVVGEVDYFKGIELEIFERHLLHQREAIYNEVQEEIGKFEKHYKLINNFLNDKLKRMKE